MDLTGLPYKSQEINPEENKQDNRQSKSYVTDGSFKKNVYLSQRITNNNTSASSRVMYDEEQALF